MITCCRSQFLLFLKFTPQNRNTGYVLSVDDLVRSLKIKDYSYRERRHAPARWSVVSGVAIRIRNVILKVRRALGVSSSLISLSSSLSYIPTTTYSILCSTTNQFLIIVTQWYKTISYQSFDTAINIHIHIASL